MYNSVLLIKWGRNFSRFQSVRSFSSAETIDSGTKIKPKDPDINLLNHKDTNNNEFQKSQKTPLSNSNHSHSNHHNCKSQASSSTNQPDRTSFSYCVNLVRQNDYENFLCTLLLPDKNSRGGMFAIRAFNTEIAMIRDQVSHKEMGIGRLVFWRDALTKLYQKKTSKQERYLPKHPVLIELSKVVWEHNLSKKWLSSLIESRERILTDAPFSDVADLEAYCDQSITSILYLALELNGVKNLDIDHAASHLGKAIGLTNFIRSLPFNATRRRVLVPQDLMVKHKVSQENFIRNTNNERIQDVVFEIASQAHTHYEKAKSMKTVVTKNKAAFPVFLSGVPALNYLQRLQKLNFNPYDSSLNRRNGLLPFNLYYKKLTKSYY